MIWPTFFKDIRLLWPLAVLTAGLQAFGTWLSLRFFLQSGPGFVLPPLFQQSGIVPMLAAALLCALVVRQDPPQGECNDWLTRPVPRARIAVTKILAVLVMIQLPLFLIDFGLGLLIGIEPAQALFAGALRAAYIFAVICLPAMGAAALAETLGQAVVGAIAIAAVLFFMDTAVLRSDMFGSINGDRHSLVAMAAFPVSVGAMGALALLLQFPLRKRRISALAAAPFALVGIVALNPGWPRLMGLDPAFAPSEEIETASFAIAFDKARGPFNHDGDSTLWQVRMSASLANISSKKASDYFRMYPSLPNEKRALLFLPLRSSGTPPGEVWTTADPLIVVRDRSETILYAVSAGFDRPTPQSREPELANGFTNGDRMVNDTSDDVGVSFDLPPGLVRLRGDEALNIEVSFDVAFLSKSREAPVREGKQALPGFGACTVSAPRPGGRSWGISCLEPRMPAYCIALDTAEPGDWTPSCSATYLPALLGQMLSGPYPRSPQGGGVLADANSKLLVQDWRPSGHARRVLRIEGIKLRDWTTAANESPPPPGAPRPPN